MIVSEKMVICHQGGISHDMQYNDDYDLLYIHYLMNIRDRCVHRACQLNELFH